MNLIERIRQVKTIGDGREVYRNAEISIREFDPEDVKPTSKYVLRHKLRTMNRARRCIDWTQLDAITKVGEHIISPPVVENDGEVDCIVDGLHRFTVAKIKKQKVKAVYVKGADRERPIIGKPVEWTDVKIRRKKPEKAEECRDLRVKDESETLRKHYRDFGFMGSSGRRPRKGQNG